MVEEGNKAVEIARLCRGGMQAVNRCGISNPNIADPVEDVLRTVKAPKAPTQSIEE
ncbi:hypothetical protein T03_8299 [Trichinella britovi]|uniref:Uncharacterized protein n=1 Tax=Trichinella britovi TaxID=45882 RepID=A0A0V1D5U2_TRIBR|nr:hypothetical protein T03_8299 [Trichinella britovi]